MSRLRESPPLNNALMLPGWQITAIQEHATEIVVEAFPPTQPTGTVSQCPKCGQVGTFLRHDYLTRTLRDMPLHGRQVRIIVRQLRLRCRNCRDTSTRPCADIASANNMTTRCLNYIQRQATTRPFLNVADEIGIDESTVRKIFRNYSDSHDQQHSTTAYTPRVLGVDDIYLHKQGRIVLVDMERGRAIEMLEENNGETLNVYFDRLPDRGRGIEVVCIDMASHFLRTVRSRLPEAVIVFDKFHVQRQALHAVDRARINYQRSLADQKTAGTSIRAQKDNNTIRFEIDRIRQYRTLFYRRRFHNFGIGLNSVLHRYLESNPCLARAYSLKEEFCDIWLASTAEEAEKRMDLWLKALTAADATYKIDEAVFDKEVAIAALTRTRRKTKSKVYHEQQPSELFAGAKRAIVDNRQYVLNYFRPEGGYTNALTEAINGKIKIMQRTGRGYLFPQIRAKTLLSEPRVARLRTRINKRPAPKDNSEQAKADRRLEATKRKERLIIPIFEFEGALCMKCWSPGCKLPIRAPDLIINDREAGNRVEQIDRYCPECFDARIGYLSARLSLKTRRHQLLSRGQAEMPFQQLGTKVNKHSVGNEKCNTAAVTNKQETAEKHSNTDAEQIAQDGILNAQCQTVGCSKLVEESVVVANNFHEDDLFGNATRYCPDCYRARDKNRRAARPSKPRARKAKTPDKTEFPKLNL